MPEKTKTGKWVFPIRDASAMKKDGWFTRKTNTKGISVRLATLKETDQTVVQAYIFDTKEGWTLDKAKKWLKKQGVIWKAELTAEQDSFKGECLGISVIGENDNSVVKNAHHEPKKKKSGGKKSKDDDDEKPGKRTPKGDDDDEKPGKRTPKGDDDDDDEKPGKRYPKRKVRSPKKSSKTNLKFTVKTPKNIKGV